jgi:hypothetical protein
VNEQELPDELVKHANGHPLEVAGYVISKYMNAPDRDKHAFGSEADRLGIESDILGMWRCELCRARFGINELDMVLGVPDPIPICPTVGCSGAGWQRVHPD